MAHFVNSTLSFVQPLRRRRIREQYTANWIVPQELPDRLQRVLYMSGAEGLIARSFSPPSPMVFFGSSAIGATIAQLESEFRTPVRLYDVRMRPLRWVIKRWAHRCNQTGIATPRSQSLALFFLPSFDRAMEGRCAWCR